VLLTRSRLCSRPKPGSSLHLHVLGTPPAFVLSQDQTLREKCDLRRAVMPDLAPSTQNGADMTRLLPTLARVRRVGRACVARALPATRVRCSVFKDRRRAAGGTLPRHGPPRKAASQYSPHRTSGARPTLIFDAPAAQANRAQEGGYPPPGRRLHPFDGRSGPPPAQLSLTRLKRRLPSWTISPSRRSAGTSSSPEPRVASPSFTPPCSISRRASLRLTPKCSASRAGR
jgi:hypothetical protein